LAGSIFYKPNPMKAYTCDICGRQIVESLGDKVFRLDLRPSNCLLAGPRAELDLCEACGTAMGTLLELKNLRKLVLKK
jgi:hypothetical protein